MNSMLTGKIKTVNIKTFGGCKEVGISMKYDDTTCSAFDYPTFDSYSHSSECEHIFDIFPLREDVLIKIRDAIDDYLKVK